jgi:hypothetical protein
MPAGVYPFEIPASAGMTKGANMTFYVEFSESATAPPEEE